MIRIIRCITRCIASRCITRCIIITNRSIISRCVTPNIIRLKKPVRDGLFLWAA